MMCVSTTDFQIFSSCRHVSIMLAGYPSIPPVWGMIFLFNFYQILLKHLGKLNGAQSGREKEVYLKKQTLTSSF